MDRIDITEYTLLPIEKIVDIDTADIWDMLIEGVRVEVTSLRRLQNGLFEIEGWPALSGDHLVHEARPGETFHIKALIPA